MAIKTPKCLAVDTSVMKAAGGSEHVLDYEAKLCRDFMEEILKLGHKIIFTEEITEEWDKYGLRRKTFVPKTISWYIQMQRKGLVYHYPADAIQLELRTAILETVEQNAIENVTKDMRWLEASLLADKCVASRDNRIRRHFQRAAKHVDEIKAIIWVNPHTPEEDCVVWLRKGAPADEHRMLGYTSSEE